MSTNQIVRAAIHPSIGIARVGDSPEFFIGPEVAGCHPQPAGGFRDPSGKLKKQAARFRLYGYNEQGQVVGEITPGGNVRVEWQVEVANTKAAWYDFVLAMDIPVAEPAPRRNPSIVGEERYQLEIRPSPRKIAGRNTSGPGYLFDDGTFMGKKVALGQLQTDDAGRLVFLGGSGVSASYDGRPVYTFANNDGWHDDVSDGPVRATVEIDGKSIPVDPAWVVCAPPNYGPEFKSIVTLYDLLTQTMIQGGWVDPSKTVSFRRDILPLFERMTRLQWLNTGFFAQFGADGPQDFLRPSLLRRLASEDPQDNELRRQVFNAFRSPEYDERQVLALPWIYGDGMEVPATNDRQWMAIPPNLYAKLEKWSRGEFVSDYGGKHDEPTSIEAVPLLQQPAMLDKAALDYCLADAFHPGCEVTWPIRHSSMYMSAFRVLHRSPLDPEPNYGDVLQPSVVYSGGWDTSTAIYGSGTSGGPLWGQRAGDLTRWMAVPWQTDTASCRDGYDSAYDEYVPTFWPARVPNQVLSQTNYDVVMNTSLPADKRIAAYRTRDEWLRVLPGGYLSQIRHMIADFGSLGVVVAEPGPSDADKLGLPTTLYVEQLPSRGKQLLTMGAPSDAQRAKAELRQVEKAAVRKRRRLER